MILWTLQSLEVYEEIKERGIFISDPSKSEYLRNFQGFESAYKWISDKMKEKPKNVVYPIWAWHTYMGKRGPIDLRTRGARNFEGPRVCLEIDVPDEEVLLTDFNKWHIVLNEIENCQKGNWDMIFDIEDSKNIQATFWILRKEQVKKVRFYRGRS